ncbi:uncharacterized protein EAF01_003601 [Botrytis porri]|uniref:Uncharacterized protein n=1 Tax=Botrytis porri TaxID=87229 RepID=A0A4Z1K9P1_9HELO|nr:uncharacterized protein EAF01_003601 [Botrytis porri]KAF7909883.1 hypothetical protein EAF01_003601 [Botrytis porri]TGO82811.1 hypothetical protein BPOR_0754g00060 [Botrytis porri]
MNYSTGFGSSNNSMDSSAMINTSVSSRSNSPNLRAPGLSFSLTIRLKNPETLDDPYKPLQYPLAPADFYSRFAEADTDADMYFETEFNDGMEEDESESQGMVEDYEPEMVRLEREETRGTNFIDCRQCAFTFDYSRASLWVPGYKRTPPKSFRYPNENTHPQIVRCPECATENCMGCENSPHDNCCSYAQYRVVWHALCAVDDAIVQHRVGSSYPRTNNPLSAAVVKALDILIEHIPKHATNSFACCELIRKSMLLDQVAVTIHNMNEENRFDTVCLQSWVFVQMLSQRQDLCGLLFEERLQFLRNLSPGVRVLGFPVAFFRMEQVFDADQYAPLTYRIWPIIQQSYQSAHEFLPSNAQLNDAWPAVMLARNIVHLHDELKPKSSPPLELIRFVQGQNLQSFAARLEEMHRVEGTQYGAVYTNNRTGPSSWVTKKRCKEDQEAVKEEKGGKRRKTTN